MTKILKAIVNGAGTFALAPAPREPYTVKGFTPHNSDNAALRSDWEKIGEDFRKVINRVNNKSQK